MIHSLGIYAIARPRNIEMMLPHELLALRYRHEFASVRSSWKFFDPVARVPNLYAIWVLLTPSFWKQPSQVAYGRYDGPICGSTFKHEDLNERLISYHRLFG